MISMASISCSSVMTRGGANLMMWSWVGLARSPFSFSLRHSFQALTSAREQKTVDDNSRSPLKYSYRIDVLYAHGRSPILYISSEQEGGLITHCWLICNSYEQALRSVLAYENNTDRRRRLVSTF